MEQQVLSQRLDAIIAELLAQKRRELNAGRKKIRVLITGDRFCSLPATLLSLKALDHAGYQLLMTFSHSAQLSGLKTACMREVDATCAGAWYSEQDPIEDDDYNSLFLPALSSNSLSKIALCIRDNITSRWVFHALSTGKPVMTTLNAECLESAASGNTRPWLGRLAEYVATLEQYGVVVVGKKMPAQNGPIAHRGKAISQPKQLITRSDILTCSSGERLTVGRHTLITAAAQDEIRRRNITVIQTA